MVVVQFASVSLWEGVNILKGHRVRAADGGIKPGVSAANPGEQIPKNCSVRGADDSFKPIYSSSKIIRTELMNSYQAIF